MLFSTHIVSDIEHIAGNVLMMRDGSLIYEGGWDGSKGNLEDFYMEEFA